MLDDAGTRYVRRYRVTYIIAVTVIIIAVEVNERA